MYRLERVSKCSQANGTESGRNAEIIIIRTPDNLDVGVYHRFGVGANYELSCVLAAFPLILRSLRTTRELLAISRFKEVVG